MHAPIWNEIIFIGKVASGAATALTIGYSFARWVGPRLPFVGRMIETQNNVSLMMSNHLPHIKQSLDSQDQVLGTIETNVAHLTKRQDDMHKGLHTLGESFLRHLEASSKETPRKKRGK
jgi:hypothetical protein